MHSQLRELLEEDGDDVTPPACHSSKDWAKDLTGKVTADLTGNGDLTGKVTSDLTRCAAEQDVWQERGEEKERGGERVFQP